MSRQAIPPDYARRIKGQRTRVALTQARLAVLLGMTASSLNCGENCLARPSMATRRLITRGRRALAAGEQQPARQRVRRGMGDVDMTENEYIRACNLGERYWLYAVLDCASANLRLVRVRNLFQKLIARQRQRGDRAGEQICKRGRERGVHNCLTRLFCTPYLECHQPVPMKNSEKRIERTFSCIIPTAIHSMSQGPRLERSN